MKILLSLCAMLFIPLGACNKSEIAEDVSLSRLDCKSTTKAVVRKQQLNDSGTEFFYYLAVDTNINGSTLVYPSRLDSHLQVDGKHLEIQYSPTSLKHIYVICLTGHDYDPSNPDEQTMPVVEVCKATATL